MLRGTSKIILRGCKVGSISSNKNIVCLSARALSTSSKGEETTDVLLYTGLFAKKMKWLRRVSLGSSILSTGFFPIAMTYQSGILPMAAQIALAGTVLFSSLSSTLLLQVVAHPYVCTLYEVVPNHEKDNVVPPAQLLAGERKFKAMRYSFIGQPVVTEFSLKQADKNVSNPFSSFQVKPHGFFYIFGGEIEDMEVRRALTKE
eukprot:gene15362-17576_t